MARTGYCERILAKTVEIQPPTIGCSASPSSAQPGSRVHVTALASDPDSDPLTFSWESTGGQIVGSGSEVELDTAHLAPSHFIVTGHVNDGHGGTADCHAEITLEAPAVEAKLVFRSIYFPTARPLSSATDKGLVESQQRTLTSLAGDFKEYLATKPDAHLELQGHADHRGFPEYNQALSERRVEITKRFLVGLGIPESNLVTKVYGEEHNMTREQVKQLVEQPQPEPGTEGQNLEELEPCDAGAKPACGHHFDRYEGTVRSPVPV
jgi:hypothetical protein